MALLPAVLVRQLAVAFACPVPDAGLAAARLAAAYESYARTALAGALPWAATGAERARLAQALHAAMIVPGTASQMAAAWGGGLLAFWMAPPVVFGGGAVTAFGGQAALVSAAQAVFSDYRNSVAAAAGRLGTALDAATRTVIVTLPGPIAVPLA